jgi:hypothetical protein
MPKHVKVHSPKPMRAPKPAKASDVGDVPAEQTAQPEKSDAEIAPAPKSNVQLEATTPAIAPAQELGLKVLEIAYANASAALQYADRISSVKSPSEFFRVSREHSRRQLELLSRQAAQLVTIAQKAGVARGEGSPMSPHHNRVEGSS